MSVRLFLAAMVAGCAISVGTQCFAGAAPSSQPDQPPTPPALVEPVKGSVSVNQGHGFQTVSSPIEANVGDAVMVDAEGVAKIAYADGCKVDVQPGTVTTITPLSPCASGSQAANPSDLWGALGLAVAAGVPTGFAIREIFRSNSNSNSSSSSSTVTSQ